jgi:tetratricopeptide (TPR) repeat protein
MSDYLALMQGSAEVLGRFPVAAILLHYPPKNDMHQAFLEHLAKDPGWSLVYWDDVCLLFLPGPRPNAYRAVEPALVEPFVGELSLAEAELEKRLREDPECVTAARLQAQLRIRQGRPEEGLRIYEALSLRYPGDPGVWLALGAALTQTGRLADAEAALRQAARLAPGSATAHYNLALALTARLREAARGGDQARAQALLKEALGEAERAVSLDQGLPGAGRLLQELQAAR